MSVRDGSDTCRSISNLRAKMTCCMCTKHSGLSLLVSHAESNMGICRATVPQLSLLGHVDEELTDVEPLGTCPPQGGCRCR
jgi:hypothetical protein